MRILSTMHNARSSVANADVIDQFFLNNSVRGTITRPQNNVVVNYVILHDAASHKLDTEFIPVMSYDVMPYEMIVREAIGMNNEHQSDQNIVESVDVRVDLNSTVDSVVRSYVDRVDDLNDNDVMDIVSFVSKEQHPHIILFVPSSQKSDFSCIQDRI